MASENESRYYIPYTSTNPSKKYDITKEEEIFFDKLLEKSSHLKGEFQLSRLSDGTVNVSYKTYPIGKIKLQGRKHSMLVLTSLYKQNSFEGTMDDFIRGIDGWIKYISTILRLK
jgi:hypothetical protein